MLAGVLSVTMLLLFPLHFTAHNFTDHYRTQNTRRTVIRHTAVEVATVDVVDGREALAASRLPAALAVPPRTFPLRAFPTPFSSLRSRLVVHLKIKLSPSDNPDPLT